MLDAITLGSIPAVRIAPEGRKELVEIINRHDALVVNVLTKVKPGAQEAFAIL